MTGPTTYPWYANRGELRMTFDFPETYRSGAMLDRHLESATRTVEQSMNRVFYPYFDTRYFDWPSPYSLADNFYVLWLEQNELISATKVLSGGKEITAGNYFLRPESGPPYSRLEVALGGAGALTTGSNAWQRSLSIQGCYGYDLSSSLAGTVAEDLDASETGVDISDSSAVDVGDAILVDSEYMIVSKRSMLSTTQILQNTLAASAAGVTLVVTDGTKFFEGETILLDSERMWIDTISGNILTVKRATEGSVLATHTASTIYAPRTLTVTRGALGSTAATHTNGAALRRHLAPGPIRSLTLALAQNGFLQELSGYARVVGSGDNARNASGRALAELKESTWEDFARRTRNAAV